VASAFLCLTTPVPARQPGDAWGTVKGQVVFDGNAVPEPVPLKVSHDQKHCLSKGPIFSEDLVVNKANKGVRWAFVWLKAAKDGPGLAIHPSLRAVAPDEVTIDQPCCKFEPHALTLRQGQVLRAKNSAPMNHCLAWSGHPLKNPGGNIILPPEQSHAIANLKADDRRPLHLTCHLHPWMRAWVWVFDHPYHAVTDGDGKFELKLAPAGECQLVVWHEKVGWVLPGKSEGMKVRVRADADTEVGRIPLRLN